MCVIHLSVYSNPVDGLGMANVPEPKAPGANEVLVAIEYAPINPNDLLVARGVYPLRPELPSVIGNEGVGRVLAVGPGVTNVAVGDRIVRHVRAGFGASEWSSRPGASLRCRGERTRNSSRCSRSIRRPHRFC